MKSFSGRGKPVLSVRGAAVVYRRRRGLFRTTATEALTDISFELYEGESLGVLGRNGAGKSTLLRLLAGIISPDRGAVDNYGNSVSLLSLQVGFDPFLSGRDNVILSGMYLGLERAEVEAKIPEIVRFSELEDYLDEPLRTYSTGMRARLGFSIAFYLDPDILLIDEVLGVGDTYFQQKSRPQMEKKIASDKTIVLVSHQAPTIKKLCNRAVWIEHGQTVLEGDVEEVVAAYEAGVARAGGGPQTPVRRPVAEPGARSV